MGRKCFSDVISEFNLNIENEYNKLRHLFFENNNLRWKTEYLKYEFITPYSACNRHFDRFPFKRTMLSLSEFDAQYGFHYDRIYANEDVDVLIGLCEYIYNLSYYLLRSYFADSAYFFEDHIQSLVRELHHEIKMKEDDGSFFIIPENEYVLAACTNLPNEQSILILQYTHYSKKKDVEYKRNTLRTIAGILEPVRAELTSNTANLFFNYVNNCNIRHNNIDPGKNYRSYIANKKLDDTIDLYDRLFSLSLLLLLEKENKKTIEGLENEKELVGK